MQRKAAKASDFDTLAFCQIGAHLLYQAFD